MTSAGVLSGLLSIALLAGAVETAPLPVPRPAPAPLTVIAPAPLPEPSEIVCRDPRLAGDPKPDIIDAGLLACGIDDPVRITSIAGVRLSPPALLGCPTARRLADWIAGPVHALALEHLQSRVAEVQVMGSYACRTQNSAAGGRMSEHARGRAIDIGGFQLTNGQTVSVARDWGSNPKGDFLRRIWRLGCGPFRTVLGPDADRHHNDHLHLDTAPADREPYCR